MLKCLQRVNWKKVGLFAAGFAFGTAGVKILSSKDAKKVYTNCTAAVLRAKDSVMKTVNTVQENAGDILADAKAINEERAAKEAEEFEDVKEDTEEAEESEKQKNIMKFIIRHESDKRMRVHFAVSRMTYKEADILLYFLNNTKNITFAKVYERTADAVIE